MTNVRFSSLALCALAVVACGGSASNDEFRSNAPTFQSVALADTDGSAGSPAEAPPSTSAGTAVTAVDCHPHLFERAHEIIGRVNRHFNKALHHVDELIEDNPKLAAGETKTWENVSNGIDRKFSMTKTVNADASVTFAFELDVAAQGSTSFVKVMDGSITHSKTAAAEENKGSVNIDFTALASVQTSERARGQISDAFDNLHDAVKGVKRTSNITLTNFLPEEGDPHGPRTGAYVHIGEPGIGGLITFQDSLVLLCPANTTGAAADLVSAARWYKAADGGVHGRSDAKATGGQIPAGASWQGVTCAKGQTTAAPAEGFWMIKEEDATGKTIVAQSASLGAEPCDPVFGAVPNMNDSSTDYDFSAAVSFPGEF